MMKNRLLFLVIISSVLLITACSQSSSKKQAAAENIEMKAAQPLLKDANGEQLQTIISSYKEDKAVLVNVWATWCIPCVEEFPEIVKIQRQYPEKLQVVFISADFPENRDDAVNFLKENNVDWTTYFKTGKDEPFINAISTDWSGALPFTKVVDINGNVIAHWENKADFDTFNKYAKQAINP